MLFAYGALTLFGGTFQVPSAKHQIGNSVTGLAPRPSGPTTPNWQRRKALPPARFGLIPFRSPLLRESLLFSSPRGTEMFQFPRFPLPALCVQAGVLSLNRTAGFPIRISTDRSSVGSSPWLFAATHVLLRHQAPRHPPLALCSLENKDARARYAVLKGRSAHGTPAIGAGCGRRGRERARLAAGSGHSLKTEQRIRQAALGELREVETYDRSPREGSQLARDQPRSVPSVGRRAVNSLERR